MCVCGGVDEKNSRKVLQDVAEKNLSDQYLKRRGKNLTGALRLKVVPIAWKELLKFFVKPLYRTKSELSMSGSDFVARLKLAHGDLATTVFKGREMLW